MRPATVPWYADWMVSSAAVLVSPQATSGELFLRIGVDAACAMWYNEYHTILNFGVNPEDLTPFFFHEHGLNFPEDGIYVMEKTLQRDLYYLREVKGQGRRYPGTSCNS